jgi:hypothetical protein
MTINSLGLVPRNPLIVRHASSAVPDDLSTKDLGACANCGARLVSEYRAIPWCERCELGLDVYEARPDASWLGRRVGAIAFRIAYRMTVSLFRGLVGRSQRRPGWSWARVMVIVASVAFYLLVAAMVGVGGWLLVYDFPSPTIVLGVLLVGIAAVLAPRFGRMGASDERLTREEAPALHAFVDRVAAAVGAPAPHAIVVGSEFGAHSARRAACTPARAFRQWRRPSAWPHPTGPYHTGQTLRGFRRADDRNARPYDGPVPVVASGERDSEPPERVQFFVARRLRLAGLERWVCRSAYGGDRCNSTRLATGGILRRSTHGPNRGHRIDRGISQRSPWRAGHGQCHRQKRPLGRD